MKTLSVSTLWLFCAGMFLMGCSSPPELLPPLDDVTAAASTPTTTPTQPKPPKKCTPSQKGSAPPTQPKRTNPSDIGPSNRSNRGGFWWSSPKSWQQMNKKERNDHMTRDVYPRIWTMFRRFDAKFDKLSNFHCGTCHGQTKNVDNPNFDIPSTLYAMDPNNMPTENDCDPKIAKAVRFMKEQVVPAMKQFVQNPKLNCFSCHAKKGADSKNVNKDEHP